MSVILLMFGLVMGALGASAYADRRRRLGGAVIWAAALVAGWAVAKWQGLA